MLNSQGVAELKMLAQHGPTGDFGVIAVKLVEGLGLNIESEPALTHRAPTMIMAGEESPGVVGLILPVLHGKIGVSGVNAARHVVE